MKSLVLIALAIFVGLTAANDKYTTENDNFDVETLIANPEEFKKFTGCFLDTNPCNDISGDFKKNIAEAFQEACAKCTDAQKHLFQRYLATLKEKYSQDLEAIKKKYDPEGKFFDALEKAVSKA
uniref:Chemosensory protein 9 n=1 Tax=Conogethes pinicolalis TaxID=1178461 RepID=A0A5P8N5J6_9NEOP|nr:chemosensory protein 9 [Conogethes pinicolalis]